MAWTDSLNVRHPMAAARVVRRERYAWPGGYELALVMGDGELLCADCVRDNFHEISTAHRDHGHTGWEPAGIASADGAEQNEWCAHCNREIFGGAGGARNDVRG